MTTMEQAIESLTKELAEGMERLEFTVLVDILLQRPNLIGKVQLAASVAEDKLAEKIRNEIERD